MPTTTLKRRLGVLSLVVSAGLVAIKFYAYRLTHSQAVLTDALESIINVFTSGFALYSIYLAGLPKDENHPYGHGKIEYLSIGFEGALIFIAGLFIFYSATVSLIHPHAVSKPDWGVALLSLTAVVNFIVGLVLIRAGKKLNSISLVGDGQHLYIDALSSLASSAALVLVAFTGIVEFDGGAALLLGIFILVNGYRMLRRAVSGLMDETDAATVTEVIAELQAQRRPAWIDVHNLRVQRYGANLHIDCHMQMPYYFTLEQIHTELHDIEELIRARFAVEVEMFVHADPCTFAACSLCLMPNCPVRQHPFQHEVEWDLHNAVRNQRHHLKPENPGLSIS
ncbi:cation diffusion facilitator family transporter [Hymenobacter sp. ASUV-10]|uniref:Cation diffusion facilitator family transporter n=1 Tax=Hymenobacter aranciens TaxID=3063996 RepID=A0ABT9B5R9_9BACT|nr:cation diffusion facilitator family transporter [Hymenobacter sp. ASUV-10]MDO7873497.1 cation diffusion facilitator family transporter [Hymenobacter sp. ASUV-10]